MAGGVKETRRAPVTLPREVHITVGVHGDDGAKQHGDDGITVADVATWMEFGTRTIPQRSFVRAWFDENQTFIADTIRKQFVAVVAGKRTADVAAERCALAFEGSVKQRISRNIPPPLAPATIAAKGSSTALIDKGQLRNAVRSKVEVK